MSGTRTPGMAMMRDSDVAPDMRCGVVDRGGWKCVDGPMPATLAPEVLAATPGTVLVRVEELPGDAVANVAAGDGRAG